MAETEEIDDPILKQLNATKSDTDPLLEQLNQKKSPIGSESSESASLQPTTPLEQPITPSIEPLPKEVEQDPVNPRIGKYLTDKQYYVTSKRVNGKPVVKQWSSIDNTFTNVTDKSILEQAYGAAKKTAQSELTAESDKGDRIELPTPETIVERTGFDTYRERNKISESVAMKSSAVQTMSSQPQINKYYQLRDLYVSTEDEGTKEQIASQMDELRTEPFEYVEPNIPVEGRGQVDVGTPLQPSIPKFTTVDEALKFTYNSLQEADELISDYNEGEDILKRVQTEYEQLAPQDPRGFFYNAAKAIDSHAEALDNANRLALGSDEEAQKFLEENYIRSKVLPRSDAQGLGKAGELAGGLTAAVVPTIATALGASAISGNPMAGLIAGGVYSAQDMARLQYANGMQAMYNEIRDKEPTTIPNLVYEQAKGYAKQTAGVQGAVGLAVGTFLPALRGTTQISSQIAKEFFKDVAINAGIDLGVGAGGQGINNYIAQQYGSDRSLFDGVAAMGGMSVAQGLIIGVLTHGVPTMSKYVSAKIREKGVNTLALSNPEQLQQQYKAAVESGANPVEVQLLQEQVNDRHNAFLQMPDDLSPKQKLDIAPLVEKRNKVAGELADKPAFKTELTAQLEQLDAEIAEKTGAPLTEKERKEYDELKAGGTEEKPLTPSDKAKLKHYDERIKTNEYINEGVPFVSDLIDKPVIYKGQEAVIVRDGQTLVAQIKGSNREFELGNIDDLSNIKASKFGIKYEGTIVSVQENGDVVVRGKVYQNKYSNPTSAINRDANGGVISVTLDTENGTKRTFKGQVAEDIAYQIELFVKDKENVAKNITSSEGALAESNPAKTVTGTEGNSETARVESMDENKIISNTKINENEKAKTSKEAEILTSKTEENAITEGNIEQGGGGEHQGTETQRGQSETGSSDSLISGRKIPQKETITGIKNAQVDAEREARGFSGAMMSASKELGQSWDEAMALMQAEPNRQNEMMAELRIKPRPLSDVENAMLLHKQITAQNEYERLNEAIVKGEDVAENTVRLAKASDDLLEIYDIGKKVGTENARGLNTRKLMAAEDYSLAAMMTQKRAANGGKPLSKEAENQVIALQKKISDTQKAFDEYMSKAEERISIAEAKKAVNEAEREVRKQKRTTTKQALKTDRESIVADIRKKLKEQRSKAYAAPIPVIPIEVLPDVARLTKNYIQEGIVRLEDIVDKIHYDLKDDFEGLTLRDVRDAISRYGYEPKKQTKSEMQLELQRLKKEAALISKQEDLATGAIDNPQLKAYKTRVEGRTKELQEKLAKGDFASKPKKNLALDEEALRLKAANEAAKDKFKEGLEKDRLSNRSLSEKAQDFFVKWERAFKLSSPITIAKLTAAALTRTAVTPIEETIGAGFSTLLPSIAKKAQREGGLNVKAESKALTEGFTKGIRDAGDVLKTGKSDLDRLFGKKGNLPPEAADFFGQMHSALKTTAKRNEFTRSFEKRMQSQINAGVDVTDPMVQTKIAVEAYKDANKAIFMQDNFISDAYRDFVNMLEHSKAHPTAGKLSASTLKFLLPFVKVPTNIVGETATYTLGTGIGAIKLANAIHKGLENVTPEEADAILRNFKKGSLGAGLFSLGYFNPDMFGGHYQKREKRDKEDVKAGEARIAGVDIPTWLLHSPAFETMQLGATVRRVKDTYVKKTGEEKGLSEGIWEGAIGLGKEIPMASEMVRIADAMENENARHRFWGEMAKNTADPSLLQFIAREMDRDEKGEKIKRKPETIGDYVKTGIPVLREDVPVKEEGGIRKVKEIQKIKPIRQLE